jgi:hypothetical protein
MHSDYTPLIEPLRTAFPHIEKLVESLPEIERLVGKRPLLRVMPAEEILRVRKMLGEIAPIHDSQLFVLANDAGDYFGFWLGGLAYSWAWYRHDQPDLMPLFRSMSSLKAALAKHPDTPDLPTADADYPDFAGKTSGQELETDRQIVTHFRQQLAGIAPTADDANVWFNYSVVMCMTPHVDAGTLIEYLDCSDDRALELAVSTLGGHRYEPARTRIEAIAAAARSSNAQMMAKGVLAKWQ